MPSKFRFPFFIELQWFALDKYASHPSVLPTNCCAARYCWALQGRTQLAAEEAELTSLLGERWEREQFRQQLGHQHLTPQVFVKFHLIHH